MGCNFFTEGDISVYSLHNTCTQRGQPLMTLQQLTQKTKTKQKNSIFPTFTAALCCYVTFHKLLMHSCKKTATRSLTILINIS